MRAPRVRWNVRCFLLLLLLLLFPRDLSVEKKNIPLPSLRGGADVWKKCLLLSCLHYEFVPPASDCVCVVDHSVTGGNMWRPLGVRLPHSATLVFRQWWVRSFHTELGCTVWSLEFLVHCKQPLQFGHCKQATPPEPVAPAAHKFNVDLLRCEEVFHVFCSHKWLVT